MIAVADQVAGAAQLASGKLGRVPVTIVRGLDLRGEGKATTSPFPPSWISSVSDTAMAVDPVAAANDILREKGYAERDLAVHPGPRGKALLKGNKIISPFSDEAALVLRVVQELVPRDAELQHRSCGRPTCVSRSAGERARR